MLAWRIGEWRWHHEEGFPHERWNDASFLSYYYDLSVLVLSYNFVVSGLRRLDFLELCSLCLLTELKQVDVTQEACMLKSGSFHMFAHADVPHILVAAGQWTLASTILGQFPRLITGVHHYTTNVGTCTCTDIAIIVRFKLWVRCLSEPSTLTIFANLVGYEPNSVWYNRTWAGHYLPGLFLTVGSRRQYKKGEHHVHVCVYPSTSCTPQAIVRRVEVCSGLPFDPVKIHEAI